MEQVFQLDRDEQAAVTEAVNKAEFFNLYREYVIAQVMLKHKDKQLRFDMQAKVFVETVNSGPQIVPPDISAV